MTRYDSIPSDQEPDTIAAFRLLVHPSSVLFNRETTQILEWIAERGAIDEAQRQLLRECRAFLLHTERSAA